VEDLKREQKLRSGEKRGEEKPSREPSQPWADEPARGSGHDAPRREEEREKGDDRLAGEDLESTGEPEACGPTFHAMRVPPREPGRGTQHPRCDRQRHPAVVELPGRDEHSRQHEREGRHVRRRVVEALGARPPPRAQEAEGGGEREVRAEGDGEGQDEEQQRVGKERPEVGVAGQRLPEGSIRLQEREHAGAHHLHRRRFPRQVGHRRVLIRDDEDAGHEGQEGETEDDAQDDERAPAHSARARAATTSRQ